MEVQGRGLRQSVRTVAAPLLVVLSVAVSIAQLVDSTVAVPRFLSWLEPVGGALRPWLGPSVFWSVLVGAWAIVIWELALARLERAGRMAANVAKMQSAIRQLPDSASGGAVGSNREWRSEPESVPVLYREANYQSAATIALLPHQLVKRVASRSPGLRSAESALFSGKVVAWTGRLSSVADMHLGDSLLVQFDVGDGAEETRVVALATAVEGLDLAPARSSISVEGAIKSIDILSVTLKPARIVAIGG